MPATFDAGAAVESDTSPFGGDIAPSVFGGNSGEALFGWHAEARECLLDALEASADGGVILLTAPRAGYGKTTLLGQVADVVRKRLTVFPVDLAAARLPTLALEQAALDALLRAPGQRPGWTKLRELAAEITAGMLAKLVASGALTSANQEQAVRILQGPPVEIFDEDGAARPIGDWIRENRGVLVQALAAAAGAFAAPSLAGPWMQALVEQAVNGSAGSLHTMREVLTAAGRAGHPILWPTAAQLRPVLLLVDHVDALAADRRAAVILASVLSELALANNLRVVLSVNQDVWQEAFGSHLPSALEDRLTTTRISLSGLTPQDASEFLRQRLERAGVAEAEAAEFEEFLLLDRHFMGRPVGSVSARSLLRHAARQWDIFRNSLPSPGEASMPANAVPDGEPSTTPSVPDDVGLPALDDGTRDYVKGIVADLNVAASGKASAEGADTAACSAAQPTEPTPNVEQAREETSARDASHVGWPAAPAESFQMGGGDLTGVTPSADALEKLRQMLSKLRQPSAPVLPVAEAAPAEGGAVFAGKTLVGAAAIDTGCAAREGGAAVAAPPEKTSRGDVLLGRFEALRLQMGAEAEAQPLDYTRLAEIIRLAGRRFPLVRFSEHELPGLAGRQAMLWSLQNLEIVFGLGQFSDTVYWRTLSAFAAGKLAELGTEWNGNGKGPVPVKLKLVTLKSDREQAAYLAMLGSGALAEPVLDALDPVHLDPGSVASLYSMQRIIREAESGVLQAEPAQVMSTLARELDFFWRRVTRLG